MDQRTIPEDLREKAEKLAADEYKAHRFGDGPAWFAACIRLAEKLLVAESQAAELREEVERLRDLCACTYQYVGAEAGEVRFLDALSAAASGEKFSTDNLLPYTPPEPNEQCNRESLRERGLKSENATLREQLTQHNRKEGINRG